MINLAAADVRAGLGRYLLTGAGLGLLIGVTLTMAGVYRGMVDDARVLLRSAQADVWVVQQHTLGPFAEPSQLHDDVDRAVAGLPGVAATGRTTYSTMQVRHAGGDLRVMVAGFEPGRPGAPAFLVAGRPVTRAHYEAVADAKTGLVPGDRVRIRRHEYAIVGLTQRMVSSNGDPMIFVPLKDGQDAQFLKDNEAIRNDRARLAANPAFDPPKVRDAVAALQTSNQSVNAVLVRVREGFDPALVAQEIRRWKHLQAYTNAEMEEILVAKLIATAAKQIGLFLVILAVVSAAIVAFILYTMTLGKLKEIAVLKLIGTRNATIAGMILQEALGLGLIGFLVGKIASLAWAPAFPKYVLALPEDAVRALVASLVIAAVASLLGIRAALRVDPAAAIGG